MNHYKGKRKTKTSTYLSNGRNMEDKNVDYLQGKGTISKLFPLFGFITIENTCDETVYFDAFCFEDGKTEKLLDLPLKVGQEVTFLANKGCDGSNAKYRAYRVWRPEYHKIFSSDGLLGRKSTFSLSSSSNLSNVSCQDSDILITGSEKPNYYTSSTFSSSSTVSEKCASNTCQEPKKLTEHNGKIYPKGEKKAQIIFGTPEECVLVINDIVFYNQNPVTNLIWHIDDGERVNFDAIETDSFHGFRWIATIVWIGNRPKCSLTDDLKNKDNMEKLIKKYSCIFESKCNFSSSLTCSADENKGFENKDAGLSVNDACSCTSSGFSEDENENNHVSNCQVENSSRYRKKSRSDYVSGRLHKKFQKENTQTIREQYLNSSCKKDQLVTFQKLSEGVLDLKEKYVEDVYGLKKDVKNIPGLTDENVKDIPGLTEEENVKDIPGLMEENVKDISGLTEENVNDIYGLTDENVKDIPGLTEENVNDVSELTEENVKDVPGLTEENVTYIPGLMKENLKDVLEPSVELFQRVLKHHPNIDEAVSVFYTITSCKSEIAHKPPLTKYSPFIVNINGENKIGEVTEEAKLIKIRTIDLKHNTSKSNAQKVKCPLLKNITFGTGTVKSVNECFVCLNIKDSVAPVFLSKIYVDGKEVSKTNRNLKSIFKENELVYFSYIHAFLSNNSEWAYVYLVWKGLKPKQFVEPTVEEFLEKLGFRNILLGSEIISHHKQEEQDHCGHKGLHSQLF
ncbi:uncharacterized protein LOC106476062 [Limulus polyphemus]|uniref:Uncharacterized protein LOC106476062 n=1 Tax=Limulus polyphemus TaxID=6850 RepID=A0ABM1C0N5_LIMPO|nr:uncharacterized protein LOC106476062 [Limulus polyphemus]